MTKFRRQLSGKLQANLAALAAEQAANWWKDILTCRFRDMTGQEQPLFIAFRNGYLSAYAEGQVICEVRWSSRAQKPCARIHHKFVLDGAEGQDHLWLTGTSLTDRQGHSKGDYAGPCMLQNWIEAASSYAASVTSSQAAEKKGIAAIIARNAQVIDVEMGLPANEPGSSAPRIDVVALEPYGEAIRVAFYEAKRFGDHGGLRGQIGDAKVLTQLERYRTWLCCDGREAEVIEATREACCLHAVIHEMRACVTNDASPLNDLVDRARRSETPLVLDKALRLIVMGSSPGLASWPRHEAKLRQAGLDGERLVWLKGLHITEEQPLADPALRLALPPMVGEADHGFGGSCAVSSEGFPTPRTALQMLSGFVPFFEGQATQLPGERPAATEEGAIVFVDGVSSDALPPEVHQTTYPPGFYESLYSAGLVRWFDWQRWADSPEGRRLANDLDAIGDAGFPQLWRLVTFFVRQERFCEGVLQEAVVDGTMAAICRRAQVLLAEMPT